MQAQTLAEQFNDVSAELERRGHGVVVRRARAFIEAGRVADAVEFLHRAQASMASDRAVAGLSSGLRAFHEAGADAAALARTTAWREGVEREAQVAHAVDTHLSRSGLRHVAVALGAADAVAAAAARVAPASPPAVAEIVSLEAAGSAAPSVPLASVLGARRPAAVSAVEVMDGLQERPLVLDDAPAPPAPPPAVKAVQATEEPIELLDLEPVVSLPGVEAPSGPATSTPAYAGLSPTPIPELQAPPELQVAPPAPPRSNVPFFIMIGVVVVFVAAAVFLALKAG
jgi:hypothetical protein